MDRSRLWSISPLFVVAMGAALFLVAVVHHTRELFALNELTWPLLALFLDATPALGLVYAGYRLFGTDISPRGYWTVSVWSLTGAFLFSAVVGATLLVQIAEARHVSEPLFLLLVVVESGGIAGFVAGYYNARAHTEAGRARAVRNALAFTNDLIRHDLQNDLSVIQGHADLLVESLGDATAGGGDPEVIADKTGEAITRIETSRVISDTLVGDPDLEPVDLVPIVTELAARTEDTFGVPVATDLPAEAFVVANAGVRSVVDNLLENAVEHNDAANPEVTIAVETGADAVRLSVHDNGPGIPDAIKPTVFEPDEYTSSGGLALVGTLVRGYAGEVWIEDNEPRGATFVVKLPRAENGA